MLPGKKYTPEDVLRILWRRAWVWLVPFAVISAGTALYTRWLPDRYLSAATIMVVPQRVPENYVRPTVTTRVEDRLRAIREQVMSRTRLERVILEFNLYAEERKRGIMQDVVERMQREVTVQPGQGDTFRVGFVADNPVTARRVAEKITGMFIDESLRQRETLAEGTSQFLETQLEDTRTRLADVEGKLAVYRQRYGPELPSQLNSNLQALSAVQMQIQQLLQAVNNNQQRRLQFERQLADLENAPPPEPEMPTAVLSPETGLPKGGTAAQQLALAREVLNGLLTRLTPEHPDIARMRRAIDELEEKAQAEALRVPLAGPSAASAAALARERQRAELQKQLDSVTQLIAAQQAEEQRLRARSFEYQKRVEATPARETEMIELTRDYGTLQEQYASLLQRREDAKMAANLERRQIGEQFEVLDPARLPERPFEPDRRGMNLMGMGVGIGLGLVLVALLEYRDRSFKTDDEIKTVLSLPVLAVVPLMRSDAEKRRARLRTAVVTTVFGSTVLVCLAIVTYTFVR